MKKFIILLSLSFSINASPIVCDRFNIHYAHRVAHSGSIQDSLIDGTLKINDLQEWDKFGNTPLHYAAFYNKKQSIIDLLKYKVDIDAKNQFGQTPAFLAMRAQHQDVVLYLVSKGANMFALDNKGQSVRSLANFSQIELLDVVDLFAHSSCLKEK